MYTYSTEQSIETDNIFYINAEETEGMVVAVIVINCKKPNSHRISVEMNMGGFAHQKLAELVQGASDYLDSLVK